MRSLATIKQIAEIMPIEGADRIQAYRVDGWWVVDQKQKYAIGDLVVYLEIDSWVPNQLAPFLSKGKEPKVYNGVQGEKLRTVRLKGQVSQGLILPVNCNEAVEQLASSYDLDNPTDLSELLGIQKYEPPISAKLAGVIRGNFPSFIRKTDQERIQNLTRKLERWASANTVWEVTEKLDGSSMTVYFNNGDFGVCSRNLDLKRPEEGDYNSFWSMADKLQLPNRMVDFGRNVAIQGELLGPGVQGNKYRMSDLVFHCFDVWDIDNQCYLPPSERLSVCTTLGVPHTPILHHRFDLPHDVTSQKILERAEGMSNLNSDTLREGIVFKSLDGKESFKAISNEWLIKYD